MNDNLIIARNRKVINMGDLPKQIVTKNTCRDCHFLAKFRILGSGRIVWFSWTNEERDASWMINGDSDFFHVWGESDGYKPECYKGVWQWENHPDHEERLRAEISRDRRDNCFYFKYKKGMTFRTAYQLFRIQNENHQLKRSYLYTQVGLWIAAVGLIANAIVQIYW